MTVAEAGTLVAPVAIIMNLTTILIIVLIVMLLGGGGMFFRGRR